MNTTLQKPPNRQNIITNYIKNKENRDRTKISKKKKLIFYNRHFTNTNRDKPNKRLANRTTRRKSRGFWYGKFNSKICVILLSNTKNFTHSVMCYQSFFVLDLQLFGKLSHRIQFLIQYPYNPSIRKIFIPVWCILRKRKTDMSQNTFKEAEVCFNRGLHNKLRF